MSPAETLSRMIRDRERDLAELQAELDVLRDGLPKAVHIAAPAINGAEPPAEGRRKIRKGTRLDMLHRLVKKAGRAGLTRHEAIEQMAAICDSTAGSVSQMLTILSKLNHISSYPDGQWRVKR